jgi:predicted transglutaminase-like cysteine proteinase
MALLILALTPSLRLLGAALDWERLHAQFKRLGGKAQDLRDWQRMLQQSKDAAMDDKLKKVNDFFNQRIEFADDQVVWGQQDYWATLLETLSKGKGDCEDYVIAKYFSLLQLQVPNERLRLIYVKAKVGSASNPLLQAHMVLAYYASPDAEPQILDNLISEIRPASRRNDLQPVFSFNNQGVFVGVDANATLGPGGVGRLTRWQDLLQRAHAEGFE